MLTALIAPSAGELLLFLITGDHDKDVGNIWTAFLSGRRISNWGMMHVNNFHMLPWLMLACSSCIEPFDPDIREQQDFLVINGMITDTPGIHRVTISKSAPYSNPEFIPMDNCVVAVEDNEGTIAYFHQAGNGVYLADLGPPFLAVGKSYSLIVETYYREQFRSDFDTLLACPWVDSVYYMESTLAGADRDINYRGIQFYNDVRGTNGGARNFRWIVTETWEYHVLWTPTHFWYRGVVQPYLEDTVYACYSSDIIQSVYAASSRLLSENSIYQNKLNYVSEQTPRLAVRYSLLVQQQSLTEASYRYWEKLAARSTRTSSFYETQPSNVEGNIYNVNHTGEKVLGCFYASQVQQKRIFVEPQDLSFVAKKIPCELDTIYNFTTFTYDNYYYLISLNPMGNGPPWVTGDKSCFDCTMSGGSNVKPVYW